MKIIMNQEQLTLLPAATRHPEHTRSSAPASPKFGVAEWAEASVNIGTGCSHNCRYCYACGNALWRNQIPSRADWTTERLKSNPPKAKKYNGRVMFPTTHDISPFYLETAVITLRANLELGNQVLIVSKPHLVCIQRLCQEFAKFKTQILFRFSIGSLDESLAAFWEPGAPRIQERVECLKFAQAAGFATSVSMEPMLSGTDDAIATFNTLAPFVTDKIWLGKMNKVSQRVDQRDPQVRRYCIDLGKLQCDAEIRRLVNALQGHPKVEWKESITEIINRSSLQAPPTRQNH
jgi:DNA repair photolyase